MVNSYDDMMGSASDPADHPATSMPQATQHFAGDVIPIRSMAGPDSMARDISTAGKQIGNEKAMSDIARRGASAVDPTNLTVFKPK